MPVSIRRGGVRMLKPHSALTILIAVGCLLTCVVPVRVIAAQNQTPAATSADLPSDQDLDALLLAKKWNDLGSALSRAKSPESVARKLDWLESRLEVGGGSLLGFIYAKDLWEIGEAQKVDDPNHDLRLTAGLITLYTYELIAISEAKDFTPEEFTGWNYYIPKERDESEWDLWYVLLVEKIDEVVVRRVGLGKVFQEAFENSCSPGKEWKEFIMA